jgi:exonuclease SbcC
MIAERAGQPLSLLVLDEVFGSLDEYRRANVVALLKRLHERFEQVIVITHIDMERPDFEHLFEVQYDKESGASRVVRLTEGPDAPESYQLEIDAA